MPGPRKVEGYTLVKILCNKFGFKVSGRTGSHVRLSKLTKQGKIGTVVPLHKNLKLRTLKSVLKLANIKEEEIEKYL